MARSDPNQINIKVNISGAKNASDEIRKVTRSVFEAKTLLNAPIRVNLGIRELSEQARRGKTDLQSLAQSVRVFRTLLVATGLERFIAGAVQMVDSLTNLQNKIRVVSDSLGAAQVAFAQIGAIATSTRAPLDTVATVYSRTARSVEELGYRQSETLKFTKVLSQAVAVGGSTAIESSQAMIQLSQGLASGTLKGDELRSVLEQLPVVSKLIADHMHISVGRLREFGMQGKLTAHDVFDSIVEGEDSIQRKFEQMIPTFEQGWEVFKTSITTAAAVFQPLVQSMAQGMIKLAGLIGDLPVIMDVLGKNFRDNSEAIKNSWLGKLLSSDGQAKGPSFGETAGNALISMLPVPLQAAYYASKGAVGDKFDKLGDQIDAAKKRNEERLALESLDETSALDPKRNDRFKKFPAKAKKEGGLTWQELIDKMKQEQEVASQTPFENGVTKEFFAKMQSLKDSVRDNLVTHAGRGGKEDKQMQQLQEMIRLEHELAEAQKFVRYWDEQIAEEKEKRAKTAIAAGEHEKEIRIKARQEIEKTNRSIEASLDPLSEYNSKINDFNTFLQTHPDQVEKVTGAVEKMGTAYQTFAPIFEGISTSIADAAANAVVFGDNLADALKKIGLSAAASTLSAGFNLGIGAIFGRPMPGLNGGNSLEPPAAVPVSRAMGGFVPGYDNGGFTGVKGRGDVAGVVHGQEFVVNANATARNRAMLESMNAGKSVGTGANVVVHNYAGASVTAAQNSHGEIEIMVRQAIADQAPGVIASDMHNPAGKTSKVLRQRYEAQRRT